MRYTTIVAEWMLKLDRPVSAREVIDSLPEVTPERIRAAFICIKKSKKYVTEVHSYGVHLKDICTREKWETEGMLKWRDFNYHGSIERLADEKYMFVGAHGRPHALLIDVDFAASLADNNPDIAAILKELNNELGL